MQHMPIISSIDDSERRSIRDMAAGNAAHANNIIS
jgi:hypothetical protein